MKRKLLSIALAATLFKTSYASALGLGEIELESYLNEPLDARIEILNTEGLLPAQVLVRLASEGDFDRVGIERSFFLTGINFQVVIDSEGDSYVAVSTREPVREPFLSFVIETKWPSGRLLREYTVLLDPPSFDDGIVISASDVVAGNGERWSDGSRSSGPSAREPVTKSEADDVTGRPEPGQNYRVKPNETLWEIAREAKLPGSSVQATMLEIQRQNPEAFINNNINLLQAGRVVYLPTELDASLSDSEVVLANIRRQNQEWQEGRVSAPSARLRIAADQFDTELEGAVAAKYESLPTQSSRSVLQVDNAKLAELQSQLAVLQEQLDVMQAIIEAKDKQIALLQNALGDADSAEPEGDTNQAVREQPDVTASQQRAEVETAVEESPIVDDVPATVVDLAAPVVAVKPRSVTQLPTKEEGLSISLIAGGVGAAALLAALGLIWQRRRSSVLVKTDETSLNRDPGIDDVFSRVDLNDAGLEIDHDSSDDPLPAHITETFSDNSKADQYASDMDINDALAEADIYIAYGRINQAVELLQGSLEKNPAADECRLKLLEVLVDAGRENEAKAAYAGVLEQCSRYVVIRADELMMRGGFLTSQQKSSGASAEDVFDLGADASLFGPYGDALDSIFTDSRGSVAEVDSEETLADESLIDLGLDEISEPASDEAGIADSSALDDADFEVSFEAEEPAVAADTTLDFDDDLDLSDFEDFDLEPAPAPELTGADIFVAHGEDAPATKLDLARAYIDMEDFDSARGILEDVASTGSDAQRREAEALLTTLL